MRPVLRRTMDFGLHRAADDPAPRRLGILCNPSPAGVALLQLSHRSRRPQLTHFLWPQAMETPPVPVRGSRPRRRHRRILARWLLGFAVAVFSSLAFCVGALTVVVARRLSVLGFAATLVVLVVPHRRRQLRRFPARRLRVLHFDLALLVLIVPNPRRRGRRVLARRLRALGCAVALAVLNGL